MATTLSALAPLVQQRLEETGDGQFWDLATEIYPFLVEALSMGSLLTGETQVRRSPSVSLVQNYTIQQVPDDIVCLTKIEGQNGSLAKTSVQSMDRMRTNWQQDVGAYPQRWAPLGLTRYVIWPKVNQPCNVVLCGLLTPAPTTRPEPPTPGAYVGTEAVNFPTQFNAGFVAFASGIARIKEGGSEMQQGVADFDYFLSQILDLSKFAIRKGSLRFTQAMGYPAKPVSTEQQ